MQDCAINVKSSVRLATRASTAARAASWVLATARTATAAAAFSCGTRGRLRARVRRTAGGRAR
jgi:hypothetical protein